MGVTYAEPDEALEESEPDAERLEEVFKRGIRRFDETVLPQQEQRALALAARRFASIPGAQWEDPAWGDLFDNSIKAEINKVASGLEKISRDYRENRIVPDFRPEGEEADQETADTLDGMHRADSYHFKAQQARDNAFDEASSGGMGAYRLTHQWADPYDKDSDAQRINPGMTIADADQRVFFDGNSKLYDKSDARFCFVLTANTKDAFTEAYGEDKTVSWPEGIVRQSRFDWYAPDMIITAEYYEVEDRKEQLLIFSHRLTGEEQRWWSSDITPEEVAELETMGWVKRTSRRRRRRIHKYLMSGQEVLKDQGFIAGECIPVVPVYGKRWYIDNQERFRGYVQLKMDPQRLYNAKVSKLAETDALAPREKPIFDPEQVPPDIAAKWALQEIERHPYALAKALRNEDGTIAHMGAVGMITPPQVGQVTALLLQIANTDLLEDQQDADEVVANTSAEAMDIAATRVDAKSGLYLDNMRQSVQREGEIYLSMAKDIYWEPGRKVETMSEDGDDGQAVLAEAYTDPKNGNHGIRNDFTRGRYKVISDVTEATATRRDKTVKSSLNIAEKAIAAQDPELAQAALLTAILNQDGEGMEDMHRYARKKGLAIGLVEPNEEEQAEMAEAQQNAEPSPADTVLLAQAKALMAQAAKDEATIEKLAAETGLTKAKVIETLTKAAALEEEAGVAVQDAETRRITATKPEPANDQDQPRQRIRMGRE